MLKKANRLKDSLNFKSVFKYGEKSNSPFFIVYKLKNDKEEARFGIIVSKYIGGAVKRNRLKRLIRESVKANLKNSFDYIIVAKKEALKLSLKEIILPI